MFGIDKQNNICYIGSTPLKGGMGMKIVGLQKLTLLDYPGKVACIIFTKGCNFRCPFCHNASLVNGPIEDEISEDEILNFLEKRKGILEGVVITGGEPLLNHDIGSFLEKIKELGYFVKLDTNGTNPKLLKQLVLEKKVDYVAMDIKNAPDEYFKATGKNDIDLELIEESKNFLLGDSVDYEFRTTVVKGIHTKESLESLAKWIEGAKRYYLQSYKDSGDIINPDGLSAFDDAEMEEFLMAVSPYVKIKNIR